MKIFKLKLIIDELPTLEKLKKRKNNIYKTTLKCPKCRRDDETQNHVWTCSYTITLIEMRKIECKEKIIKKLLKIRPDTNQQVINNINYHKC